MTDAQRRVCTLAQRHKRSKEEVKGVFTGSVGREDGEHRPVMEGALFIYPTQ